VPQHLASILCLALGTLALGSTPAAADDVNGPSADLAVTKVDTPDPATAGSDLFYTITVTNAGPDTATSVSLTDTLPAETYFVSLAAPGGWSCSTPAPGFGGTVSCSIASLAPGSAVFTINAAVRPEVLAGSEITNLASASSETADPDPKNQVGVATTTVETSVDLAVTKVDTPDPVGAGANLVYTITVTNTGPSNAASLTFSDPLPAGTTFVALPTPGIWICSTPAVGASGTITCTVPTLAPGAAVFTITVAVDSGLAAGTVLTNTATISSPTPDYNPGNESASADTTVVHGAVVSGTKTVGGQLYFGGTVIYTVVLTNTGTEPQVDSPGNEFTDILPTSRLNLVSATATSGTAVANPGTNTATWSGSIASGGSVTITIEATVKVPEGTVVSNQGNVAYDSNGDGATDTLVTTDDPAVGGTADPTVFTVGGAPPSPVEVPTLDGVGLALLSLLLALGGAGLLRRRARS